ncbi:MAG: pyruvate kinase [Roseofilum sp. SBFL]|uniref:pyruvate kinase n=1 Tax=unclassified Roseofilum TaxID=2620099 RepID=UPI001B2C5B3C|nr:MULTISPECIES: pyruvate kinase [unclassified Roseofilum]MBP0015674.1 pyruvate kinase [Roseofilum sp. SID3]MBP0022815.1 pyruvate kinase [Roseofilum sp. SID2]MBP0037798.1 pyruvate kinase [Roseofilum sp. SID1]MBP0042888.1 pyruvate kinase [Roseofilum sp. SBFL]
MNSSLSRTKVVATIGPASNKLEVLRELVQAGMRVARLNFSHGSYDDHAKVVSRLRQVSEELDIPVTLLQDLQGPKIRVGRFPEGELDLIPGASVTLVPEAEYNGQEQTIPIDYPFLAEEAQSGAQVLLDDGLLELKIMSIQGNQVECKVIEGGILKNRKGVNLPSLSLRLPSMTEKDKQDLIFGLDQGIDWVSLSFVRSAEDIITLREFLHEHKADHVQVMAKIEKPQAVENLEAIMQQCDGLMVARGDLGVEMSPERVPKLQKRIIQLCNQQGVPVITATQMLDSMIRNPRPTRAEASDVANAIMDGTDAVMLSGESAVGAYPVKAVEMLVRIARDTEKEAEFVNYPPAEIDETHALSEALNTIDKILDLRCIACFTTSGYTATLAAAERPKAPVVAFTPRDRVYHRLNLVWGVKPMLLENPEDSLEQLILQINEQLLAKNLAAPGDKILVLGGSPVQKIRGTNFIKIHRIQG